MINNEQTKRFHILPMKGIIQQYFPKGVSRVYEKYNFHLKTGTEKFKERTLSWKHVLSHKVDGNESLNKNYNFIESKTTPIEQGWLKVRYEKIVKNEDGFLKFESIDRKFFSYLIEKMIVSYGEVEISFNSEFLERNITPNYSLVSIGPYIDWKAKKLKNLPIEDDEKHFDKFGRILNKSKWIYTHKIENLLTSEPIQFKTLILRGKAIKTMFFQCGPKTMITIPLSKDFYPELVSGESNDIIFKTFYSQADIVSVFLNNGIDMEQKLRNWLQNKNARVAPNFIYSIDKDLKEKYHFEQNWITPTPIAGFKMKQEFNLKDIARMASVMDDTLNFMNGREELIPTKVNIRMMGECSAIMMMKEDVCYLRRVKLFNYYYDDIEMSFSNVTMYKGGMDYRFFKFDKESCKWIDTNDKFINLTSFENWKNILQ